MGRKTQQKIDKFEENEHRIAHFLHYGTRKNKEKIVSIEEQDNLVYNDIKHFEDFFLKKFEDRPILKSRDLQKRKHSIVRHLLNRYKVPKYFYDVWDDGIQYGNLTKVHSLSNSKLPNIKSLYKKEDFLKDWYLCVAQGGSLYKDYAKNYMTKSEVFNFLNCPFKCTFAEAMWFSIAKSAGASNGYAFAIAKTKMKSYVFEDDWKHVARWFAAREDSRVNVDKMNDLIDFIHSRKMQADLRNVEFSLNGQTIQAVIRRTELWHQELNRMKSIGGGTWEGLPIANKKYTTGKEENKIEWEFIQIKTGNDLALEGNKMRHCVAAYKGMCMGGEISIWSLRKNGERALTIEIGKHGSIRQARGLANRSARPDEMKVLNAWKSDCGFTSFGY